jgi:hypothetical protein
MQSHHCQTQLSTSKLTVIFILVLGTKFVYFDSQLTNKFLISSIWPLIWSISTPTFMRPFQFSHCFEFFQSTL